MEYQTIRDVKAAVNIPVFANGDIDSPQKAAEVMAFTGADGVLIGRAAQGRPWIFRQMNVHRGFNITDGVIFHRGLITAGAGAAMDRQRDNTRVFGHLRNTHGITHVRRPAGAHFQRDRHIHRRDNGVEDVVYQPFVAHQRRTSGFITDLFGRAAHIDVDDLSTGCHIEARGFGHDIRSLAVHGRTRACGYQPTVEYDTIRDVKASVSIPVFANGDIDSPEKAAQVMQHTGADGVLIGRAAQGRPWIFRQISHYLATGEVLPDPSTDEVRDILLGHLDGLYQFYGEYLGVRIARKHVSWYLQNQPGDGFRKHFNQLGCPDTQIKAVQTYFSDSINKKDKVA